MTEPNDHPMDKYIGGEGGWNEFTPDEQVMLGSAIAEAAELRPDWLSREEREPGGDQQFASLFRQRR